MVFWDIENKIGLKLKKSFRRFEVELLYEEPQLRGATVFFPDPFYMTLRTFDFDFGGTKAKKACEIELSSYEEFQKDKYLIWTPRKSGTSLVIIYEPEYVQKLYDMGVDSVIFKPVCLLSVCKEGEVVVDVGENTLSISCWIAPNRFRLGFFKYIDKNDIRNYVTAFLAHLEDKNVKFKVCGKRYDNFPFECELIRPSDFFEVSVDDPAFTSLFASALGKYPSVKLKSPRKKEGIELILQRTTPIALLTSIVLILGIIPVLFEFQYLKEKRASLLNKSYRIFQEVFPGRKPVDPYSELKMEYMKFKGNGSISGFQVFVKFSEAVSPYVMRIEDFSFDSKEISAQLKIREISDIEKIKSNLEKFFKDVKITSTVRSREGDSYIMRVSGKL